VRESRIAFQAATEAEFIAAAERSCPAGCARSRAPSIRTPTSCIETFHFEPRESGPDGNGTLTVERAGSLGVDGQVGV